MTQHTFQLPSASMPSASMPSASIIASPAPGAAAGWTARIEQAFVRWQAKRLQEIPAGRLWAQAMQDTRSFAEIRRGQK